MLLEVNCVFCPKLDISETKNLARFQSIFCALAQKIQTFLLASILHSLFELCDNILLSAKFLLSTLF